LTHSVTTARPLVSVTTSFREFAERWTSGELARLYPGHVREKRSAEDERLRLERHVYPVIGALPLTAFTLDHAEAVMQVNAVRALPRVSTPHFPTNVPHLSMAVFPVWLI
jgi:hypothetical protein